MSLVPAASPSPAPRAPALVLAALGPVTIGGLLAARSESPGPLFAVPAIVFGVVAATSPALYIASAAVGAAPSLMRVVRAFGVALGAFGIALAGLLLPGAFLALTSLGAPTTVAVASVMLGAAAALALARLRRELASETNSISLAPGLLFVVWGCATLGIAGRLWWDLAREVVS